MMGYREFYQVQVVTSMTVVMSAWFSLCPLLARSQLSTLPADLSLHNYREMEMYQTLILSLEPAPSLPI